MGWDILKKGKEHLELRAKDKRSRKVRSTASPNGDPSHSSNTYYDHQASSSTQPATEFPTHQPSNQPTHSSTSFPLSTKADFSYIGNGYGSGSGRPRGNSFDYVEHSSYSHDGFQGGGRHTRSDFSPRDEPPRRRSNPQVGFPNEFDFNERVWRLDDYKNTFRALRKEILDAFDERTYRRLFNNPQHEQDCPTNKLPGLLVNEYHASNVRNEELKGKLLQREKQIRELSSGNTALRLGFEEQIRQLDRELKNTKGSLEESRIRIQTIGNSLETKFQKEQEDRNIQWRIRIDTLKRDYEQRIGNKQHEIDVLVAQCASLETAKKDTERTLREEMRNNEALHQEVKRRLEESQAVQIANLTQLKCAELDALKQDHKEKQEELETNFALHRGQMIEHARKEKQERENEQKRLTAEHSKTVVELNGRYDAMVLQKDAERQRDVEKLKRDAEHQDRRRREENKSLSKTVFARLEQEGFIAIPDRTLAERFSFWVADVQSLARRKWRQDQAVWTTKIVTTFSQNVSRFREQLLLDTLWGILHECMFCSPFRAFGEEGRLLETQWITAAAIHQKDKSGREYSNPLDGEMKVGDYTWPIPELKTEEWRYKTVKGAQSALREPTSSLDARYRVKLGFKQNRDDLLEQLKSAISAVAELDQPVITDIERLVKKAASMWLDFETQRCRLMTTMPGSWVPRMQDVSREEMRLDLARQRNLVLTLQPGLIRWGDEDGLDLHVMQTVGSLEAESWRVPATKA